MDEGNVRVYFQLNPEDWHGHASEGIWAEPINTSSSGLIYRLINSPFFARGISYLDVVRVKPRSDNAVGVEFAGVIAYGGHSSYMILVPPDSPGFAALWKQLEELGCTYEWTPIDLSIGPRNLYAVDIPESTDIYKACSILEAGRDEDVWLFQEGHCGHPLQPQMSQKGG
jgi:Domain of unknown function (DUF4265)